ncbi:hypothetical protein Dsin_008872 [Dipteronia sinensis]|uniref:RNase H type-1 domain-containing protein n=1 Tax=Dipteronia sinensis TaxID=43782 RepID=A0AAE0AQS5_9ROSI|nr:hypothetical protein Dsin_008872 [Dipteronia sinensis]
MASKSQDNIMWTNDLMILRRFGFRDRPTTVPVIKSVIWSHPALGWIKVNTYGTVLSSLGVGGCGGVFCNYRAFVNGYFTIPIGCSPRSEQVPWRVRQVWQRCIFQISQMDFHVSHIFKEGNHVTDVLSKHALELEADSWMFSTSSFCSLLIGIDYIGQKSFRFS